MDSYSLIRGSRTVMLKEEDMTVAKIGRIFQIKSDTVYLTSEENMAIFAFQGDRFSNIDLRHGGRYHVHGDPVDPITSSGRNVTANPNFSLQVPSDPVRFTFTQNHDSQRPSAPNPAMKTFQRTVFLAEANQGKLHPTTSIVIRFREVDACVPGMVAKVQEALRTQAAIVLMDAIGNPIHDSDGTKGSLFWRQNSRKIYAMEEDNFNEFITKTKRRRTSQQEKDELTGVHEKIEEVVLAAEGLPWVVAGLKELAGLKSALTRQQILAMRDAFSCAICKDIMEDPMASSCCRSLIGCRLCVEQWLESSSQCVKCRGDSPRQSLTRISGLGEALVVMKDICQQE